MISRICNEKVHVVTRFSIHLPSGFHVCMAVDSMRLKAVSFCALLPSRAMCISVQRCSRRIAGVWMLFVIARVSFVTVSHFNRYLIMLDFGHRCSQLCNDVWMLRIELFSGRAVLLKAIARCFAHLCAEQSMSSFHNVFRL